MSREMMDEGEVPHTFQGEETQAVVYLANMAQLRPNRDKTPYVLWEGRQKLMNHFKVFGIKCYIEINDKYIGKLDSQTNEGISLGYLVKSKGYKFFKKKTKMVEYFIDIVVHKIHPHLEPSR